MLYHIIHRCIDCDWAATGYCPIGTSKGCIEWNGQCIMSLEEFEREKRLYK